MLFWLSLTQVTRLGSASSGHTSRRCDDTNGKRQSGGPVVRGSGSWRPVERDSTPRLIDKRFADGGMVDPAGAGPEYRESGAA